MQVTLARKLAAEGLGTALLVAAVIGSGIRPADVAGFITAQAVGATLGGVIFSWLVPLAKRGPTFS